MTERRGLPAVTLPSGVTMPVMGQGTWKMGEQRSERAREVAALKLGIDLGLTLIDTAEMYGDGGAEEIVAAAIEDRRDEVFIVSKVYPHNASRRGTIAACDRSLQRLGVDHIDLYLLHWRGSHPLTDTVRAFEELRASGKIGGWGVSNFDAGDLDELNSIKDGRNCAVNQVLYNLAHRGIEWDVLPWCNSREVPVMAYCPVDQGGPMLRSDALKSVAARHDATPAQIALAWLVRQPGVVAIPKAVGEAHLRANRAALDIVLSKADVDALDIEFSPPHRKVPLAMT